MEGLSLRVNRRSFFLDSTVTSSTGLELYMDAAMSVGFGGYLLVNSSRGNGSLTCV